MFCYNCDIYRWDQPADESTIKHCSRCKFICYCSKECQKEHWEKVHKKQCKYLAREKVKPLSRHDPGNCSGCKQQADTGLVEMAKQNNPVLGCGIPKDFDPIIFPLGVKDSNKIPAPLPIQLGEMSGKFQTKQEHTVSIAIRILNKMGMIKHPAWIICLDGMTRLMKALLVVRMRIWNVHTLSSSEPVMEGQLREIIGEPISEIYPIIDLIASKLKRVLDPSLFQHWNTLLILLEFLLTCCLDEFRRDAEVAGLPELSHDIHETRLTSEQFNSKWQGVLDSMADGMLVPYTVLVKQVCGGSIYQVCRGCARDVTVTTIMTSTSPKIGPGYYLFSSNAFVCGDPLCDIQVGNNGTSLFYTIMQISSGCRGSICDTCHLPSTTGKVHRCTRCLTKQYCGVQCRDKDWVKVHKDLCRKNEVKRKVKGGKDHRKEEGKTCAENNMKLLNGAMKLHRDALNNTE